MLKNKLKTALTAVCMSVIATVMTVAPAFATGGTVQCSTSTIVGMWVEVSGGTSGWATRTATSDHRINFWSYNTQGKAWKTNVGCGGTPQNWGQSISSGLTSLQMSNVGVICTDIGYVRTCQIN